MNVVVIKPRLLDRLRSKIRLKGYSHATEKNYAYWAKRHVLFHDKRHPAEMGVQEVETFLSNLVSREQVSAATQNQALCALLFLYRHVLDKPLEGIKAFKSKHTQQIPTVLTVAEVQRLFGHMSGTMRLMAELVYGSGMRISETHGLRIQDIHFSTKCILVHDGKGRKDRFTLLPERLVKPLHRHLLKLKALHIDDLTAGYGASVMPRAYAKRMPRARKDFIWQFVFPSRARFHDKATGVSGRWHIHTSTLQKSVQRAAQAAGLRKRVTVHTRRHSFATHLLQDGCDIRKIQALLGHAHINTTMIYVHIMDAQQLAVVSPLDRHLSSRMDGVGGLEPGMRHTAELFRQ